MLPPRAGSGGETHGAPVRRVLRRGRRAFDGTGTGGRPPHPVAAEALRHRAATDASRADGSKSGGLHRGAGPGRCEEERCDHRRDLAGTPVAPTSGAGGAPRRARCPTRRAAHHVAARRALAMLGGNPFGDPSTRRGRRGIVAHRSSVGLGRGWSVGVSCARVYRGGRPGARARSSALHTLARLARRRWRRRNFVVAAGAFAGRSTDVATGIASSVIRHAGMRGRRCRRGPPTTSPAKRGARAGGGWAGWASMQYGSRRSSLPSSDPRSGSAPAWPRVGWTRLHRPALGAFPEPTCEPAFRRARRSART